jgi:hypothetical protein
LIEVEKVEHLRSEEEVAQLGEGEEDDEEHDREPAHILGRLKGI